MRIEIDHKGDKKFFSEILNISVQYGKLLKNPRKKLKNLLMRPYCYLAAFALLLVIDIVLYFLYGARKVQILYALLCVAFMVRNIYAIRKNNGIIKRMAEQGEKEILQLDEEGVSLISENKDTMHMAWSNVAFLRQFKQEFCFMGKTGMMFSIDPGHKEEILRYIKEHSIPVEVIE